MGIKEAMIPQPLAGKTKAEIVAVREKAVTDLKEHGYRFCDTPLTAEWYDSQKSQDSGDENISLYLIEENFKRMGVLHTPLKYLANSITVMSMCHAVYFCKGWENSVGCRLEHDAAVAYGLEIIYEE